MEGDAGRDAGPQAARVLVVAVAVALVSAHLLKGLERLPTEPGAGLLVVAACVALVALQLRHTRADGGGERTTSAWTVAELVIGFLVVGPLGVSVGLLCLPAASLLLERRRQLAVVFVAGAVLVEALHASGLSDGVDMLMTVLSGGVMLYAVTTLARLATRVHAARVTLAASAVTDERLRIAASLSSRLADGFAEMHAIAVRQQPDSLDELIAVARRTLSAARATSAELRSLSLAPEAASAQALLASAGIAAEIRVGHREPLGPAGTVLAMVLREAVTAVVRVGDARTCEVVTAERGGRVVLRVVGDGVPTAAIGAEELDDLADRVHAAGGRLTVGLEPDGRFAVEASVAATTAPPAAADPPELRTALGLYLVILVAFAVKVLLFVPGPVLALGVVCTLAFCAYQVRYSIQDAARHARSALLVSTLLALVPLPWLGRNWIGAAGIVAGSLLIALPRRAAVVSAVGVTLTAGVISNAAHNSWAGQGGPASVLLITLNALITCVVVYAVLRLIRLVRELQRAGTGLARAAVVTERLRAARDLHDLLGHGLAAIVLKAELARRLARTGTDAGADAGAGTDTGTDAHDDRWRSELKDIVLLTERGQAELGTVTGAGPRLSLAAELASAARVLEAAEITVELEEEPFPGTTPESVGAVLSVVLREAVTNVLRHSSARYTRIAVLVREGNARLEVENDGAPDRITVPGSGIGGLTLRLAEVGGTLAAGPDDGWYLLRAEVPLD